MEGTSRSGHLCTLIAIYMGGPLMNRELVRAIFFYNESVFIVVGITFCFDVWTHERIELIFFSDGTNELGCLLVLTR